MATALCINPHPPAQSTTIYPGLFPPRANTAGQGLTDQSTHYSPLYLTVYNKAQNGPEGLISLGII